MRTIPSSIIVQATVSVPGHRSTLSRTPLHHKWQFLHNCFRQAWCRSGGCAEFAGGLYTYDVSTGAFRGSRRFDGSAESGQWGRAAYSWDWALRGPAGREGNGGRKRAGNLAAAASKEVPSAVRVTTILARVLGLKQTRVVGSRSPRTVWSSTWPRAPRVPICSGCCKRPVVHDAYEGRFRLSDVVGMRLWLRVHHPATAASALAPP